MAATNDSSRPFSLGLLLVVSLNCLMTFFLFMLAFGWIQPSEIRPPWAVSETQIRRSIADNPYMAPMNEELRKATFELGVAVEQAAQDMDFIVRQREQGNVDSLLWLLRQQAERLKTTGY